MKWFKWIFFFSLYSFNFIRYENFHYKIGFVAGFAQLQAGMSEVNMLNRDIG